MEKLEFDDGSSIEWFSKETLLYRNGDYSVELEYGYFKESILKAGRIIFGSLVSDWSGCPAETPVRIDEKAKEEIIEKAKVYFESRGFKVRVQ